MSEPQNHMSRRKAMAGIGASGIVLAHHSARALAEETEMQATENIRLTRYPTVRAMKAGDGDSFAETAGFYAPGDGGAACYRIQNAKAKPSPTVLTSSLSKMT